MNFFEKIVDKMGFQRKASSIYQVPITPSASVIGQPTQQNYTTYLQQYADAPWVYACIYRIATKGLEPNLKLYKKKIKNGIIEYVEITVHPIIDLLRKANPYKTGKDLQESTIAYEELTGNAYWLLDTFKGGKPTELFTLRPDRITVIPSKTDYIKHYDYDLGRGESIHIPKEFIIHFNYNNPTDDFYGLSPLSAARVAVDTQGLGDEYNKRFFINSAMPEGALVSKDLMVPAQVKQANHAWKQMHGGVGNAHRIAILSGGMEWQQIGMSQKDMEFIESKKLTREDILGVFGVPPAMVGVFEYANYANAQEQREIFWRDTMIPKLTKYAAIINEFLVKPWDEALEIRFDFSTVEALKENEKLKAETDEILTRSGIKTINEARAERSMTAVAWGETWNRPFGLAPVSADEVTPAESQEPEEEKKGSIEMQLINIKEKMKSIMPADTCTTEGEQALVDVKLEPMDITEDAKLDEEEQRISDALAEEAKIAAMVKEIRNKKWEIYKDLEETWEKKFIPILVKYFSDLEAEVNNNLEKITWKEFGKIIRSSQKQNKDQQIDDIIFDVSAANKKAKNISKPIIAGSLEANAVKEIAALSLGIDFDLENPEVVKFIDNKTFTFAKEVNETTQESLRKTLKEAIKDGEGIEEASKRVSKVFEIAKTSRTKAIARTEIIGSTNAGAMSAYEQSGVVAEKEWITTRDKEVRGTDVDDVYNHLIDGERVKLKGKFSNGLKFPGDPSGAPGNIINCRCTISGIVEGN